MERHAVKGTKTEVRDNGHDSNDGGGETSTQKETLSNPNSKRRRAYKVMLEEETIAGDALEGRSQPEKKKIDIEGRYPQGSWEQATVEAIMNLRTFDTATTTSQIAQTIIANLKDENDFLRAENAKLQWELKSMQESHEAELQASKDELQSLKQRFPYAVEHATSPPTTVTETGVVQAVETEARPPAPIRDIILDKALNEDGNRPSLIKRESDSLQQPSLITDSAWHHTSSSGLAFDGKTATGSCIFLLGDFRARRYSLAEKSIIVMMILALLLPALLAVRVS
ncbi:hypothetical protein JZ751_018217, partial [Albula glossodonta]